MKQPIVITNLALAAALASYGIPFFEDGDGSPPFTKMKTQNGSSYAFFFEEKNEEGEETNTYVNAWFDDLYVDNNKEHPFAYIKCAFKNRETLLDVVNKSASIVIVQKGNRYALVSSNASEEIKEKVFGRL